MCGILGIITSPADFVPVGDTTDVFLRCPWAAVYPDMIAKLTRHTGALSVHNNDDPATREQPSTFLVSLRTNAKAFSSLRQIRTLHNFPTTFFILAKRIEKAINTIVEINLSHKGIHSPLGPIGRTNSCFRRLLIGPPSFYLPGSLNSLCTHNLSKTSYVNTLSFLSYGRATDSFGHRLSLFFLDQLFSHTDECDEILSTRIRKSG